jgi:DNA-directed RNA polymerase subunit RPC12/RpoP
MTLYQCDRCGEQQHSDMQQVELVKNFVYPYRWELCEKCIQKLREFMKGDKT